MVVCALCLQAQATIGGTAYQVEVVPTHDLPEKPKFTEHQVSLHFFIRMKKKLSIYKIVHGCQLLVFLFGLAFLHFHVAPDRSRAGRKGRSINDGCELSHVQGNVKWW